MNDPKKTMTALAMAAIASAMMAPSRADASGRYCDSKEPINPSGNTESVESESILILPGNLPEAFSIRVPFSGQVLTLHLEKNKVFGKNTKFLVSDGTGNLTQLDPGLDRSYLGSVSERSDFAVSAVLTETGLIANIIRPGEESIVVTPVRKTAAGSLHNISVGISGDHQVSQSKAAADATVSPLLRDDDEMAASNEPITTSFEPDGPAPAPASSATLPPSRVMDVLEYEIGVEIGSNAFLSSGAYNGNLSLAQATAQSLIGNLDARFLRGAGIKHRLGTVIIRTDAATDPLRSSVTQGNSSSLSAFKNYWNGHSSEVGSTHDLAVYHVKWSPSGIAYVNSVGGGSRYALSCGNGATSWADGTIVHEFGHSWNLRHTGDSPISEYDYGNGGTPPSSFYESKPRNNSGSSAAGGSHVFVSVMHGGGDHNIGRLSSDEANTLYGIRQNKRGYGDLVANPGGIKPFGRRDSLTIAGNGPTTIDVIANDYDANNDVLDAELLDTVSQQGGTISLSTGTGPGGRNELTYTPPATLQGITDFFHYTVRDATGKSDWGAVYLTNGDLRTVDIDQDTYYYDPGTASSPVFSDSNYTATAITPTVYGDIYWSGATTNAVDRGSSAGNGFNRDLIYGSGVSTFNHILADGKYNITLNMSDPSTNLDNMYVRAETLLKLSDIDRPIGQNGTLGFTVDVTDGELNLEFGDADTANPRWAVNRIVVARLGDLMTVDTTARSYIYDPGPVGSPVFSNSSYTATPIHIGTIGDVSWSGASLKAVDRGAETGNGFNRDLIYGFGVSTFNHKLSNGRYNITLNMSDPSTNLDNMYVRAENLPGLSDIDHPIGTNTTLNFQVDVTDGELNLEFGDAGASNRRWAVTRIVLTKVHDIIIVDPDTTSYNYDPGPVDSPVQSGWTAINPDVTGDVYWSGAAISSVDRNPGGGINDINRDFIHGSGVSQLNHKLPNGIWTLTMNMGDADLTRDLMSVSAEGNIIKSNFTSAAGVFTYAIGREVAITDGELNLEFFDGGGTDPNWVITRLSLAWVRALSPPVANSASVSAISGIPIPITLTGSDPDRDSIRFQVVTQAIHGTLSGTPPNLTYTATFGYEGPDPFTFITKDASLNSPPATISITVGNPDSDGDGLSDGFEYVHYGHKSANTDGTGDLDSDGINDRTELIAGTDSEDPASLFRLTDDRIQASRVGNSTTVALKWISQPGRTYKVWQSATLEPGNWVPLASDVPAAAGTTTTHNVTVTGDQFFFRVSINPQ